MKRRIEGVCGALGTALALLVCAAGCGKGASISEMEERERNSRLFATAMADCQAGRMDAAMKGFEKVLLEEPKSYLAHFQLATLLEDVRKDYIGAVAHYRSYLALRPASDKAHVANERLKKCMSLLQAEMLRKAGGSAANKFAADNAKLEKEKAELAGRVKRLEGELAKAKAEMAALERDNASKHRLIEKLGGAMEQGAAPRSKAVREALAELRREREGAGRRRLDPTDAELLDEGDAPEPRSLSDAKARYGSDAGGAGPAGVDAGALQAAKDLAADADRAGPGEKPPAAKPVAARPRPMPGGGTRPETYVVQSGDTLSKISLRFYGTRNMWRSIQNANRATVPMDGRLSAGQTIRLP